MCLCLNTPLGGQDSGAASAWEGPAGRGAKPKAEAPVPIRAAVGRRVLRASVRSHLPTASGTGDRSSKGGCQRCICLKILGGFFTSYFVKKWKVMYCLHQQKSILGSTAYQRFLLFILYYVNITSPFPNTNEAKCTGNDFVGFLCVLAFFPFLGNWEFLGRTLFLGLFRGVFFVLIDAC